MLEQRLRRIHDPTPLQDLDAPMDDDAHFERDAHFDGRHATEHLVEIGPFDSVSLRRVA